ncbi:MAG: hypothetical protein RMJ28_07445 [Nitrososphaerota archaeon]|nr:hypothetical protein [Candidatus Calditenuaceae archaeon]MDW8074046.1 hypothetical protein [Nitrososphaerota archaeon]
MTNKSSKLATNLKGSNHNSEFIELLDALKRYGPRNLSLISMLTGIPRETVRYKVKKQLRNLGFKIQMIPNFYKMGLTRLYAKLSFSRSGIKIAQKILKELGLNSYLSYYSKIAFSNDYLVLINPPSKWANTFNKLFDELQSEGIVESFSVKEVKEVGYPHVTYRLFDFEKGSWNLSEDEAPNGEGVVVMQKASVDETANYLIDSTDLLILTELEGDAFKPLTKVSSSVSRDSRLLRYHFQEHIVRKGLIAGYVLSWFPRGDDAPNLSRMWIKTNPLPSHKLGELSKAIASSPFCKFYQTLEDNTLLTYLLIDRQFSPAVRHLSDLFTEYDAIGESLIVEDSLLFSITKEMFKDGYGWLRPTISINRITVNEIELGGRGD